MKSPFLGLRTCIYKVSELDKAKAWYGKAFGVEPYFEEPFYVGFSIRGYELGLLPEEGEAMIKGEGVNTYWGVEDVQKTFDQLISMGATAHEQPQNVGGELMVGAVKDPWGNIVGMIYNPHFKLED